MKINHVQTYTCEICQETYSTAEAAIECESMPVTGSRGARVGDLVLVTNGDGRGHKAKATSVGIHSKERGRYQWKRYWHTVFVIADLIDEPGSRLLSFDSYTV